MANNISFGRRTITVIPDGTADFDIATVQARAFPLGTITGNFTIGESVSQATSGATGVVQDWKNKTLYLNNMVGTFNATNVITGGSSGATGTPKYVGIAFPMGIRLSAIDFYGPSTSDHLVVRDRVITGPIIFERKDVGGGGLHKATGGRSLKVRPVIDASECSFATAANTRIIFEYD